MRRSNKKNNDSSFTTRRGLLLSVLIAAFIALVFLLVVFSGVLGNGVLQAPVASAATPSASAPLAAEDPVDVKLGAARIGQRAEQIEDRPDADLLARRPHMTGRRVVRERRRGH